MKTMIIRRFFAILIALLTLYGAHHGMTEGDVFTPGAFPLISPTAQEKGTVRVMSFNIRCYDVGGTDLKYRIPLVPAEVNEVRPDSFGVQEATPEWREKLKKLLPEYDSVGEDRDGSGTGESCTVYYLRARYRLLDSGTFWLSETPDVPSRGWDAACNRVCTWAVLQNRFTGDTYVHVNSHFDHVGKTAVVQAGKMVNDFIDERFPSLPVVFTADLNALVGSPAYNAMTTNLVNTAMVAEDSIRFGTFHGCHPETHQDYEIDFVLCSPDLTVKTYRVVTAGINGRFVSDHFPVYADIVVKNGSGIC